MVPRRIERISEAIREELDELISYEMADPRIREASVVEVLISPDGRLARVRLHMTGNEAEQQQMLSALEHARSWLRAQLAERLELYRVPDLRFEAALSAQLSAKAPALLRRIRRGRAKEGGEPGP
jgi:ribosome-binding factor A